MSDITVRIPGAEDSEKAFSVSNFNRFSNRPASNRPGSIICHLSAERKFVRSAILLNSPERIGRVEARTGIEPVYTALQAGA